MVSLLRDQSRSAALFELSEGADAATATLLQLPAHVNPHVRLLSHKPHKAPAWIEVPHQCVGRTGSGPARLNLNTGNRSIFARRLATRGQTPRIGHKVQDRAGLDMLEVNREFYNPLWADARLVAPERFNTWPLVSSLLAPGQRRLEVAPGLRPRLPLADTQFADLSAPAVAKLRARGADAVVSQVSALPYADGAFDLVCALDIIEHVADDHGALAELGRVAAAGAVLLLSAPLHPAYWTPFDDFVGHFRRYEPSQLQTLLGTHGFTIEKSAVYGMRRPGSSRLMDLGMWTLTHRRSRAMWWYNRVFVPVGMHFQKKLVFGPGMMDADQVDELLLVCRKGAALPPGASAPAH
jgi:SAM-dependent methyltransferase